MTETEWIDRESQARRAYAKAFMDCLDEKGYRNTPDDKVLAQKQNWLEVTALSPMSWSYLGGTPDGYACSSCAVKGLKMWRRIHSSNELFCMSCGKKDQAHNDRKTNLFGSIAEFDWRKSDQLGSLLPAVPDYDGTYWGYASVPELGCEWWRALPDVPVGYLEVRDG